jgi:hypothetical protein
MTCGFRLACSLLASPNRVYGLAHGYFLAWTRWRSTRYIFTKLGRFVGRIEGNNHGSYSKVKFLSPSKKSTDPIVSVSPPRRTTKSEWPFYTDEVLRRNQ